MKKILAVICASFLSISLANAEVTIGISGNAGLLSADAQETITGVTGGDVVWGASTAAARAAGTATAATKTKESDDVAIGYVSLFGEVGVFDTGLRIGVSYVPYALESETTENVRNDNCGVRDPALGVDHSALCQKTTNKVGVDLEDLISTYIAYHHDLDVPFISSVFIKAGLIEADVITRDILSSGSQYGNTQLKGEFFGLGVEKDLVDQGLFVRLEGNVTQFDSIQLKNSNSDNTNTIDITGLDGATATISIGKTF